MKAAERTRRICLFLCLTALAATLFAPATFAQFDDEKFIKPPPPEESPLDALTGYTPPPEYGPGSAKPGGTRLYTWKTKRLRIELRIGSLPFTRDPHAQIMEAQEEFSYPITYELETPVNQEQVEPGDTVVSGLDLLHRFNFIKLVIDF
ncbi:MAG TPA: hypothetical protein PKW95_24170 [bacterium]|nr:hypothetical protein [bacterium]